MAFKCGDREQIRLLPPTIEEYVTEDCPVRTYDSIVEALDFDELGIEIDENKVGNSAYYPKSMLKLLVYGYSYGFKSSRKLERACYDNFSFVWLMGGLKPDHKTIAEFRRNNIEALKNVLKQTVQLCIKFDLVDGNVLFVDGSKFRANAGKSQSHSPEWCEKQLKKLDERIDELLEKCEAQGHRLRYGGPDNTKKRSYYKIEDYHLCRQCQHFGKCTTSREGRRVYRYWNEESTERFEQQYLESQEIYKLRQQRVELPFGHMKHNLGYGHLLLRGLENVQGEVALLSSCFNMARLIGALGAQGLMRKLSGMESHQPA